MNVQFRCAIVLLVSVLLFAGGLLADDTPKKEAAAKEVADSFKSGGASIEVLRFEPPGSEKRPAVIMLHGADGWGPMTGFRFAAAGLNANGHVAILIRYYDRTKTPDKISAEQRGDFVKWLKGDAVMDKDNSARRHFVEWIDTVQDAVAYVRKLPNVDGNQVGVVGFSLGGYLALSAAPKCDPPVTAVVEMFGGIPHEYCKKPGKIPPTLIVHGEEDDVVSVSEAYKAAGVVLAQKQLVAIEIHKGVGHVCCRPGSETPDAIELMKARNHMTGFFKKQFESTPKK